jgi:redox-sensitive bicupin YhaK (pirin superfamily)
MITIRKAHDRGHFDFGWLDTYHTFSFGDYYDPNFMGFSELRVINEDRVASRTGFPTHGHRDMEIITYVLEGALQHRDNMGNGSVIRPGDVQRMTAGTGVTHSEANPSATDPVHLLQIWILPEQTGLQPGYEQKTFATADKQNQLRLIASRDGREGSVTINQNASVYASLLGPGKTVNHNLAANRSAWLQLVSGSVTVNGKQLQAGDGVAINDEDGVKVIGLDESEMLLFDLP